MAKAQFSMVVITPVATNDDAVEVFERYFAGHSTHAFGVALSSTRSAPVTHRLCHFKGKDLTSIAADHLVIAAMPTGLLGTPPEEDVDGTTIAWGSGGILSLLLAQAACKALTVDWISASDGRTPPEHVADVLAAEGLQVVSL